MIKRFDSGQAALQYAAWNGPFLGDDKRAPLLQRFGTQTATDLENTHCWSYNEIMARGWESKSVEAQIESAAKQAPIHEPELTPEEWQILRERENLELSRTRVQRELAASKNPRYQQILRKALADLDAKLTRLEPSRRASTAGAQ